MLRRMGKLDVVSILSIAAVLSLIQRSWGEDCGCICNFKTSKHYLASGKGVCENLELHEKIIATTVEKIGDWQETVNFVKNNKLTLNQIVKGKKKATEASVECPKDCAESDNVKKKFSDLKESIDQLKRQTKEDIDQLKRQTKEDIEEKLKNYAEAKEMNNRFSDLGNSLKLLQKRSNDLGSEIAKQEDLRKKIENLSELAVKLERGFVEEENLTRKSETNLAETQKTVISLLRYIRKMLSSADRALKLLPKYYVSSELTAYIKGTLSNFSMELEEDVEDLKKFRQSVNSGTWNGFVEDESDVEITTSTGPPANPCHPKWLDNHTFICA